MKIAFDIGGTFTDVLVLGADKQLATAKVLSLLDQVGNDIVNCVREIQSQARVERFTHGTTICSNAVIENKVARTGLLTTEGFRDVLALRDQRGPSAPTVEWEPPEPLVPRTLCLEVRERVLSNGEIAVALDTEGARASIRALKSKGVDAIAVCLINSYANLEHEVRLGKLIEEEAPGTTYCLSSDISPEMREYPRTCTTVINASLRPVVTDYMDRLERRLEPLGSDVAVMQSNGGIITSRKARQKPMYMIESGPAAGVLAAARFAADAGLDNVISFDMGGTTAKACLIRNGVPLEKPQMSIGSSSTSGGWTHDLGHIVRVPSIDLVEVGAGGGSIAWIEGGILRVGPHSAGADPGPVCYGKGGKQATVTDANVALGKISPEFLGGGRLRVNREAALGSLSPIASQLGIDVLHAAHGVTEVTNAVMTRALRAVSVERGYDARDFVLLAFGGAGPVHAAALAENIGIRQVLIPSFPGLFSALGLLLADYRFDHVASASKVLSKWTSEELINRFRDLEDAAREEVQRAGLPVVDLKFERKLDVRYAHQIDELSLPLINVAEKTDVVQAVKDLFTAAHVREFGFPGDGEMVIVNLRLRAVVRGDSIALQELCGAYASESRPLSSARSRKVYFGGAHGLLDVPVRSRASISGKVQGPLLVEEPDTTVVVPPQWCASRDKAGSLLLSRE
jgi:N-methylhydantoinase A